MAEPMRFFEGRANLSRPLTRLDMLELRIPADVVKALVDDPEIRAIPRHEEQDGGIELQQMVAPDNILTFGQRWLNVVYYNGPWMAYNVGPVTF